MTQKSLRIVAINFSFSASTASVSLDSDTALFDFDVVLIRPPQLPTPQGPAQMSTHDHLERVMAHKKQELKTLFAQGGVLVIVLDVPSFYSFKVERQRMVKTYSVGNYDFVDANLAKCLSKGSGTQVAFTTSNEPFVEVLKKSTVAWTTYLTAMPQPPLNAFTFFARAGAAGFLAGKMAYGEGHIILLPNLTRLDDVSFLEVCAEYRFKKQGTMPPAWVRRVFVPGLAEIETSIGLLETQIADLNAQREKRLMDADASSAYRKLLYEKGKTQLEPIVLRGLDDIGFGTMPSEMIGGIHEIDGRTSNGSNPGILEVKGSKNQISQSEFSPFITKIVADADIKGVYSKGIFVGNGLCEADPSTRLGDSVFSKHVVEGAKRHSIALLNSVELFWLCCTQMRGDIVDKNAVRETILTGNGYVDLKQFSGASPF